VVKVQKGTSFSERQFCMNVVMPESREKEIFLELFSRAEKGTAVAAAVAERHGVSVDAVRDIERKGLAKDWPPLD
jgi:hypothetical protein